VALIREGLLEFSKQQISRNGSFNLRYPTDERIPIKFKVGVLVEVGELSMELPVYVVDMKDDCLLTPCRTLTSLTRDNNFGPNMDITSQTREKKCGPNVNITSETRGTKCGPNVNITSQSREARASVLVTLHFSFQEKFNKLLHNVKKEAS